MGARREHFGYLSGGTFGPMPDLPVLVNRNFAGQPAPR